MNYFIGPDPVTLDRYNAYVRPSLQLQQTDTRQNARLQQLNGEVQILKQSGTGPTGKGGTFQNYSHFYSMPVVADERHRGPIFEDKV